MTDGQRLYEFESPSHIRVRHADDRFRTGEVMLMENEKHVPWRFLSERYRQTWEVTAKGHWFILEYHKTHTAV